MIKHVIFDLGNVLIHVHQKKVMRLFSETCRQSSEKIQSFYLSDLHNLIMEGKISPNDFYHQATRRYGCNITKAKFFQIWREMIGEEKEGIPRIIESLEPKYTLSILSNTDAIHWEKVEKDYPLIKSFDHFFLSFRLHLAKPDERIYRYVLEELQAKGEECVFVDDTEINITAAAEFGIKGILANEPQDVERELKKMGVLL